MSNGNKESFKWVDEWDKRGDRSPESLLGWAHAGMATTKKQEIITSDSGESRILVFSVKGELVTSWKGNFVDAHGITVAQEVNQEVMRLYGSLTMDPKENLRILTNIRPALAQSLGGCLNASTAGKRSWN